LDTARPFAAGIVRDAPNHGSNGHGVHQAARMRDILQLAVFRAQHQIFACPNAKVAAWVLWVIADGTDATVSACLGAAVNAASSVSPRSVHMPLRRSAPQMPVHWLSRAHELARVLASCQCPKPP